MYSFDDCLYLSDEVNAETPMDFNIFRQQKHVFMIMMQMRKPSTNQRVSNIFMFKNSVFYKLVEA